MGMSNPVDCCWWVLCYMAIAQRMDCRYGPADSVHVPTPAITMLHITTGSLWNASRSTWFKLRGGIVLVLAGVDD